MRRAPLVVSVLAIVLLGLVALARTGPTAAQDATPPAGGPGFVGSWLMVGTIAQGPTVLTLVTVGADGTVVSSGPPAEPPPSGAPYGVVFTSAGHGAWAATGPDTAVVTSVVQQSDEGGPISGP